MQTVRKHLEHCPNYTKHLREMQISTEKAIRATEGEIKSIRQAISRLKKDGYNFETCKIKETDENGKETSFYYVWRLPDLFKPKK